MKLYIIGRLKNSMGQIEAYKLYDPQAKEARMYAKESIVRAARNGHKIVGLEPNKVNRDGEVVYIDCKPSYQANRTDSLDGRGNPINGPKVRCIISTYGFCEYRRYRTVNSLGEEKWLNGDEIITGLQNGEIVGAVLNKRGFRLHKDCDPQDKTYEDTEEFKRESGISEAKETEGCGAKEACGVKDIRTCGAKGGCEVNGGMWGQGGM